MEGTLPHLALAESPIEDLREKIRVARERKNYFERYLNELLKDYVKEKISREFYVAALYKRFDGRTIKEWIVYYDTYIKRCEELISKSQRNTVKKNFLIVFISAVIIFLLVFSFNQIQPRFVGFSVQEPFQTGIIDESNTKTNITQHEAVLGQPVKWSKTISLDKPAGATVTLPGKAENIAVKKRTESQSYSETQGVLQTYTQQSPFQEEPPASDFLSRILRITGGVIGTQQEPIKQIEIQDNATGYQVEYETPAPTAIEQDIERGKRIKISSPETVHYQNVLAFTNLSEKLNIKNPSQVKIYWIENDTYVSPSSVQDTDNNGIYDRIEWIIPHLSTQTFNIIVITKAEHLDQGKNFISDIYPQVSQLDNIWSEPINDNEYVRVVFEIPLDKTRDITIYPRIVLGKPKIEVYEKDGNEKIAEFTTVNNDDYNKVFLDGSSGTGLGNKTQDSFDLKVVGGSVEFDYIVDPHSQQLTISGGTTELCGNEARYDKILVTSTGILQICARNSTANTGWLNISLGTAGNFTVEPGGLINGLGDGGAGGALSTSTSANATQGENGDNWTVGSAKNLPNGGGGGAGGRSSNAGSAGGGGGAFGGNGGIGDAQSTNSRRSTAGVAYGSTNSLVLLGGSGGGGGSGDAGATNGAAGGAGLKIDAGLGIININGEVKLNGTNASGGAAADQGSGGGGSGGHLILNAAQINLNSAQINISGGRGGDATGTTDNCAGGGGGGGRAYFVYSTMSNTSATISAIGGAAGTSTGCDLGVAAGSAGTVTYNSTAGSFTDNKPQWSNPTVNNSNPSTGAVVIHNVSWTDDGELDLVILEVNGTGASCDTVANVSSESIFGSYNQSNLTWVIPTACSGKAIGWRQWGFDWPNNQSNVTSTQVYEVQAVADDPPKYQFASVNDTSPLPNTAVRHNINWTDDIALSFAKLEVNSSGASCNTAANVSETGLSTKSAWANLTWGVPNACENQVIGWKQWANDSANQGNLTTMQAYRVQNISPTASFGTNPVAAYNSSSNSITFEFKVSDNLNVDALRLYGNWTGTWGINQTNMTAVNDSYWNVTVIGIPDGRNHVWTAWGNDTIGNSDFTDTNRTFTVDTVAPTITLPFYTNGTIKKNTDTLILNISVADTTTTPQTCLIDVTGTNQTIVYSSGWCNGTISLTGLSDGNQTLKIWANDSVGNFGLNNSYVVQIDTTNPIFTVIPSNATITYPTDWTGADFEATDTNFGSYYINDTARFTINSTGFLDNVGSLSAGNYLIIVSVNDTAGNVNATTYSLTISQSTEALWVVFNATSPITYPQVFNVSSNASTAFTIYRNGTTVSNNSMQELGAGAYNFTVTRTDNVNYSDSYDERQFVISKATLTGTLASSHSGGFSYTYDNAATTISSSESNNGDGDVNYTIYRNSTFVGGETINLPAGVYSYVLNSTGGVNWTTNSSIDTRNLIISKATPTLSLSVTNSTYPINAFINASEGNSVDGDLTYNLYVNSVLDSSGSSINLDKDFSAGTFVIVYNTTGGTNFTSGANSTVVSIVQGNPAASLTNDKAWNREYDGTSNSISYSESNTGDADLNYTLWRNDTYKTTPDLVSAVGAYSYKINTTGGTNWTANASMGTNVLYIVDTTPPIVTLPIYTNGTKYSSTGSLIFNISVSDSGVGASYCSVNVAGNSNQTIVVSSGWCNGTYSLTGISDGNQTINAYANDSAGNLGINNSYVIQMDSTAPAWLRNTTEWDISTAVNTNNLSTVGQDTNTNGLIINSSGTGMYIVGSTGDKVHQYYLSTPWLVSSAANTNNLSIIGQEATPTGIFINDSGTGMYIVGSTGDKVYQYYLSTPWLVSSAVNTNNLSIIGQTGNARDLFLNSSGTGMWIPSVEGSLTTIRVYYLSTPWLVTSATNTANVTLGTDTQTQGLFINSSGTGMYSTGINQNKTYQYYLSTPWDVSTYVNTMNLSMVEDNIAGVFINSSGTGMYFVGLTDDKAYQYDMPTILLNNGTTAGSWIDHSVLWADAGGLTNYTFSFDNGTGTFVNDSSGSITGTINESSVLKNVNQTAGSTIRWQIWTWDVTGNNNVTSIFSYVTTSGNTAPTIPFVGAIPATDPKIGTTKAITFNFTARDTNGASNINTSTAKGYFQRSGETTRSNTSCSSWASAGNDVNFTCTIDMWYYDQNGAWTINVTVQDNSQLYAENSSTTFTYNLLTAMNMSPNSLSWASPINLQDTNTGSNNDPIQVNNTGNAVNLNINVTAYNLRGEQTTTQFIFASNFTISNATEGCSGTAMVNATSTNITSAILQRGNNTLNYNNETSGQEQIYFCLKGVPHDISSQSYSSSAYGAWEIRVLLVALFPRRKKKSKKETGENKLIESLDLLEYLHIVDKLKEQYKFSNEEIVKEIIEKASKKYGMNREELLRIIKAREGITIPLGIFSKDIGALESISKYMKENLNMSYREIARELKRDERTIWTAYKKATQKQKGPIEIKEGINIPISVFENKELTVLESIILHLKEKGSKFSEIAKILDRDQRNIWTIYSKAKEKITNKE